MSEKVVIMKVMLDTNNWTKDGMMFSEIKEVEVSSLKIEDVKKQYPNLIIERVLTVEEYKAEQEEHKKWLKIVEERTRKEKEREERRKARKIELEKIRAKEMGISVEEYRARKRNEVKIRKCQKEIERLEKEIEEQKKKMEYYKNKY